MKRNVPYAIILPIVVVCFAVMLMIRSRLEPAEEAGRTSRPLPPESRLRSLTPTLFASRASLTTILEPIARELVAALSINHVNYRSTGVDACLTSGPLCSMAL